jgi:hypothetical protein
MSDWQKTGKLAYTRPDGTTHDLIQINPQDVAEMSKATASAVGIPVYFCVWPSEPKNEGSSQ